MKLGVIIHESEVVTPRNKAERLELNPEQLEKLHGMTGLPYATLQTIFAGEDPERVKRMDGSLAALCRYLAQQCTRTVCKGQGRAYIRAKEVREVLNLPTAEWEAYEALQHALGVQLHIVPDATQTITPVVLRRLLDESSSQRRDTSRLNMHRLSASSEENKFVFLYSAPGAMLDTQEKNSVVPCYPWDESEETLREALTSAMNSLNQPSHQPCPGAAL
jgi:hypothetical protein